MNALVLVAFLVLPSCILGGQQKNLVEVLVGSDPEFTTLVTAVKAADLVETLSGAGPFTVLAPNNAAFDKLPKGTLEALLADIPALKKILLRHVVAAKVESADVTAGPVETVGGEIITAGVFTGTSGTTVTFTNADGVKATVITADVQASNGVAHVIDTVI